MEVLNKFINNPFGLMVIGWLFYNFGKLMLAKDEFDDHNESFSLKVYFFKTWDNWIFNFMTGLVVIAVGVNKIDISGVGVEWSDLFYLMPGPAAEFAVDKYKAWRKTKQ